MFGYLWEENLQENTIVIITSDHGDSLGELNLITHSFNNQGDRESTLHVPLLISFPQTYRFKSRNAQIACIIADIPPTIYDILGIDWIRLSKTTLPGNYGKSLLPYIRDGLLPVYGHSVLTSEKMKLNQQQRDKENHKVIERLKSLGYINLIDMFVKMRSDISSRDALVIVPRKKFIYRVCKRRARLPGTEPLSLTDAYSHLHARTSIARINAHYLCFTVRENNNGSIYA